jgi:hypothetical protein
MQLFSIEAVDTNVAVHSLLSGQRDLLRSGQGHSGRLAPSLPSREFHSHVLVVYPSWPTNFVSLISITPTSTHHLQLSPQPTTMSPSSITSQQTKGTHPPLTPFAFESTGSDKPTTRPPGNHMIR